MTFATQSVRTERNVTEVCHALLDGRSDDILVVGPSPAVIDGLLDALDDHTDPPTIRLLAAESVLKTFVRDFTDAATLADFVATDVVSLSVSADLFDGPLVLTDDEVVSVVSTENRSAILSTDDETFAATAREEYTACWENAEPFSLRTPPLSRVHETMNEEFGSETTADFERMRASLARDDASGDLDEVDISLLAAAKNEVLLYDLSTWGESVGLASRATFSRKKTQFEDAGLIETEKVPIDVGRPRLRLLLGDDRLRDATDLVATAEELLADADV
ncbi:transcriptional regulator TbsP [Halococcus sp. IIIV-5B]|uniref:transcriptional regulator TbsP n=1 Tax=Halococcus sp. IIIV-5B TaxID=2321230 RepID=UPI000E71258F|nr:DUF5821 family protein [Halococcus sp. IIIV-5B]RJT05225.1 hypothetical protein D3261_07515 [Halococcus sp. IIIV-5B]